MEGLHQAYATALEQLAEAIQNSETLAAFLEEDDDQKYKSLCEEFEPTIHEFYEQVAANHPLQLESFENYLLEEKFEGLYLPKILGYSVLRGYVDQNTKYTVPQNHFRDILNAIINSPNFDYIKNRIGQTVKIGFALSSDIWITNLLESIENKKVKAFLSTCKSQELRENDKRLDAYNKYKNQFSYINYLSTDIPTDSIQLVAGYQPLKNFLMYRAVKGLDNNSLVPHLSNIITKPEMRGSSEYLDIMIIIGLLFPLSDDLKTAYSNTMESLLSNNDSNVALFFKLYDQLLAEHAEAVLPEHELNLKSLLANVHSPEIKQYFETVSEIHSKGFVSPDSMDAVRNYYDNHKGLSNENECVRAVVMGYIQRFLDNLEPEQYPDYFEINKIITAYMNIFSNEKFNQHVKECSMNYTKKCFKKYTDKRSKDYQDVKKFVSTTFVDLGFLTDKQVVEMFKTRRKPTESK